MTNDTPDAKEGIDTRTRKALEEPLSVVDLDGTPLEDTDVSMVRVISHTGGDYRVDVRDGRCTCPDAEYNLNDGEACKHEIRARFALGRTPIESDTLVACEVDTNFADHVAADPQVVATDGGRLQRAESEHERTRVPVAGGVLVFESRDVGKELVGFEDVDEWDGVRSALSARGIGVGAIHYLPVLDDSDDSADIDRHEPADFGHGESTGVQQL